MLTPKIVTAIGAVLVLGAAGCGEATTTAPRTDSATATATTTVRKPKTALTVRAPRDGQTVHRGQITVTGTTSPGAKVTIDGDDVRVEGDGRWRARHRLALGDSVMVVEATSDGAEPATRSLSLTRKRNAAERAALAAARERRRQAAAARRAQAEANFKASATAIPYKVLNKDADAQKGKRVVFRGQVFQIQQDGENGGIMLLSVTDEGYGLWTDNIWVDYDHATTANEDDIVTVYGTITGSKSYDTQIGGTTYVPRMHARYVVTTG